MTERKGYSVLLVVLAVHMGCSKPSAEPSEQAASGGADHQVTQPAPPSAAKVDPDVEKALRDRVTAYWGARSDQDLVAAYAFYEPTFRATYSTNQFLSNFQRLLRFKPEFLGIDQVRFEAERRAATVGVRLRTKPDVLLGETLVTVSEETWQLLDGVWYRQAEGLMPTI